MASIIELTKKAFDKVEEFRKWNSLCEAEKIILEQLRKDNDAEQKRKDDIIKKHELDILSIKEKNILEQNKSDLIKTEINTRETRLSDINKDIKEGEGKLLGIKNSLIETTFDFEQKKSNMNNEISLIETKLQDISTSFGYENTRNIALVNLNNELEEKAKANMIQQSLDAGEYDKLKEKIKSAKKIIAKANGRI